MKGDVISKFFKFFIPFFYMVATFILLVKGVEILGRLNGSSLYVVAFCILFMTFGAIGIIFKESDL